LFTEATPMDSLDFWQAIASIRAIRVWYYYRCAAYLTALQLAAICWVACTCNIHPTVSSCCVAPSARYYGTDPVMETHRPYCPPLCESC